MWAPKQNQSKCNWISLCSTFCCITTYMECTIIQLCTHNLIYQHVDIYTAQTNTFSQVKYYYNVFFFLFSINVSLFHYKISLKCSSTNVLVFVFKFFSYNQTDNPLLSSTVKYITRINIMLQQRPVSPPTGPPPSPPNTSCSPTGPPPSQAPPVSALQVSLPPPVNSQIHKQTNRGVWKCRWWSRATLQNHNVTLGRGKKRGREAGDRRGGKC